MDVTEEIIPDQIVLQETIDGAVPEEVIPAGTGKALESAWLFLTFSCVLFAPLVLFASFALFAKSRFVS